MPLGRAALGLGQTYYSIALYYASPANRQFDPTLVDLFVGKVAPGAAETQAARETRTSA